MKIESNPFARGFRGDWRKYSDAPPNKKSKNDKRDKSRQQQQQQHQQQSTELPEINTEQFVCPIDPMEGEEDNDPPPGGKYSRRTETYARKRPHSNHTSPKNISPPKKEPLQPQSQITVASLRDILPHTPPRKFEETAALASSSVSQNPRTPESYVENQLTYDMTDRVVDSNRLDPVTESSSPDSLQCSEQSLNHTESPPPISSVNAQVVTQTELKAEPQSGVREPSPEPQTVPTVEILPSESKDDDEHPNTNHDTMVEYSPDETNETLEGADADLVVDEESETMVRTENG